MSNAEDWPFPTAVDDGASDHIRPGDQLPDMALPATSGPRVNPAVFGGWVLFAIYPWTGRPGLADPPGWDDVPGGHGSTQQLIGLGERAEAFAQRGISVFGVSRQKTAHQAEFIARVGLPFALLSDAGGAFGEALCLPMLQAGNERYLRRMGIMARDGVIAAKVYPAHPPPAFVQLSLSAFDDLAA